MTKSILCVLPTVRLKAAAVLTRYAMWMRRNCSLTEFTEKWLLPETIAVYVDWSLKQGNLVREIKYDKPLEEKGNERAKKLISLLKEFNISI